MNSTDDPKASTLSLRERVQNLRLPPEMEAGKRRAGVALPWILLVLVVIGAGALQLRSSLVSRAAEAKASNATPSKDPAASSGEVVLESKGYVIPAHQIQVSPKVSGMVVELNVEEGKRVKEGDVLAVLEKINYEAAANRARAALASAASRHEEMRSGPLEEELESAKAAWDEAKAQRDQLFLDWKRNSNLRMGNALSPRDLEVAESAFKAMDRRARKLEQDYRLLRRGYRAERILAAKGEVDQARADLVTAEWNLDNCTIRAPVSGTILSKKAEKGNIVNSTAFNVSASLCEMADLSDLEIDLNIQERDVSVIHPQQRCRIRSEAYPDRAYHGVVSRLMPIADQAKGAIPVRVKLLNVSREEEGVFLKPQMSVIVSFLKAAP